MALTPGQKTPPAFVVANFVMACCWRVPVLPLPGQTLQASALSMEPGGKGLNVAVGLQRLGLRVVPFLACGKDAAGDALIALLGRERLSLAHVHRMDEASGCGAGLIGDNGQNAIAVYPGANLALHETHALAAADAIRASALVYGQFETSHTAVAQSFAIAAAAGIPTVLNPSPWATPLSAIQTHTSVLLVNETEAQDLLCLPLPLAVGWRASHAQIKGSLSTLWAAWPTLRLCVVTLGAEGCLVYTRGGFAGHLPARNVNVLDTLGAGDAFACGFCAVLAQAGEGALDNPDVLHTACTWGQWCGGHMASCHGVLNALVDAETLQQGLAAQVNSPWHLLSQ